MPDRDLLVGQLHGEIFALADNVLLEHWVQDWVQLLLDVLNQHWHSSCQAVLRKHAFTCETDASLAAMSSRLQMTFQVFRLYRPVPIHTPPVCNPWLLPVTGSVLLYPDSITWQKLRLIMNMLDSADGGIDEANVFIND